MSATMKHSLPPTKLLIDGKWVGAKDGVTQDVFNPATGEKIASLAVASPSDVDAAVKAAQHAFKSGEWSQLSGAERGKLLWKLADAVEANREQLAYLESIDIGRPQAEPFLFEIPMVVEVLRHFAGWADKVTGRSFQLEPFAGKDRYSFTLRQPLGVVGAITPWNAPTMITSWKLAPALAVGNTIVIKPAMEASLSTLKLAELAQQVGFPPGVINIVTGSGSTAGQALVEHPGVNKVSFTGSPEVGAQIARTAGPEFKKVTLELGGKSPQIVRADADLDEVMLGAATAVFANQGQTCAAGTRIFVHESLVDEFAQRLAEIAANLHVGDPLAPETQMGSLVNEKQLERVMGYIEKGKAEGAKLVQGGNRIDGQGHFVEPTVFIGTNDMTIAREEIFGPVGTIIPFSTDDEALAMANDSKYGLVAVVWTKDLGAAHWFAKQLEAGAIWVNAWGPPHPALPWLGVKTSGVGEELGHAGLLANTQEKAVSILA